jgi:hypothetical protein
MTTLSTIPVGGPTSSGSTLLPPRSPHLILMVCCSAMAAGLATQGAGPEREPTIGPKTFYCFAAWDPRSQRPPQRQTNRRSRMRSAYSLVPRSPLARLSPPPLAAVSRRRPAVLSALVGTFARASSSTQTRSWHQVLWRCTRRGRRELRRWPRCGPCEGRTLCLLLFRSRPIGESDGPPSPARASESPGGSYPAWGEFNPQVSADGNAGIPGLGRGHPHDLDSHSPFSSRGAASAGRRKGQWSGRYAPTRRRRRGPALPARRCLSILANLYRHRVPACGTRGCNGVPMCRSGQEEEIIMQPAGKVTCRRARMKDEG